MLFAVVLLGSVGVASAQQGKSQRPSTLTTKQATTTATGKVLSADQEKELRLKNGTQAKKFAARQPKAKKAN